VREYWLIDPDKETIEVLDLSPDGAQLRGHQGGDDIVSSQVLGWLQFRMRDILPGRARELGDTSKSGGDIAHWRQNA